ncbi:hypothetical protein ACLOJK_012241 [Asimina triloba]
MNTKTTTRGGSRMMESFVCEIQSLKLFRRPKPCGSTPKATNMNNTLKTRHARQLPPALLMSRSVPLDDLNHRISPQSRRPEASKATAPDQPNPQPEPDLDRRVFVSDEEEEGENEADLSRSAEVLEHMEEEAITGDDVGRDAVDYSRRARLFDKSSRVFQDLKERDDQSGGPSSCHK